jgi:hypothetical protein
MFGFVAVARSIPGCRNVEAILHDARDHIANRLRKNYNSPARRAQHARQVGKRQQRKRIDACLHPVERDYIVYDAVAQPLPWIQFQ